MTDTRPGPSGPRGSPATSEDEEALRPPLALLAVAGVAIVASALLLFIQGEAADLIGYVLATVVTVLAVALYRSVDSRRRSRPTYVIPVIAQKLNPTVITWVLLLLGVVLGVIHVWGFADSVARA